MLRGAGLPVQLGLGFGPVDFEKHNRLARGEQTILKSTLHHVVVCLRDGRCYQPLSVVLKARVCDTGSKGLGLIQLIIDYGTSRGSGLSTSVFFIGG